MAAYGINAGDVAAADRPPESRPAGRADRPAAGRPPASPSTCPSTPWAGCRRRSSSATSSSRSTRAFPLTPATAAVAPAQAGSGLPAPGLANPLQGSSAIGRRPSVPHGAGTAARQHRHAAGGHDAAARQPAAPAAARRPAAAHRPAAAARPAAAQRRRRRHGGGGTTGSGTSGGVGSARRRRNLRRRIAPARSPACRSTARRRDAAASGIVAGTTLGGAAASPSAGIVRLRDVGRVELGAQNYRQAHDLRRPSFGRHGRLSASRHQCPRHRRTRESEDEGIGEAVPRGRRLQNRLRHHAVHPRVGRGRVQDPVGGRGVWSAWWCWSFCRTGDRC